MDVFEYGFRGSRFAPMRRRRQREEQSSDRMLDTGVNTLQRNLVLKKQVQVNEVNEQLKQKQLEFKGRIQAVEQSRSELLYEQQETKYRTAKFEKFVEKNEVKRRRALKKYQLERKQNELKEKEKSELSAQLEQLQIRQQHLKERVDKYKIFEDYLMKILDLLPENYLEYGADSLVMPIIRRHETLSITQQDLLQHLASLAEEMDQGQRNLDSLKQEHNITKLMTNKELSELQTECDQIKEKNKQLEMTQHIHQGQSRDQVEETGSLLIAVKNIGQLCHLPHYGQLEDMDMLTMMDMIKEFILEKMDMERRALWLTDLRMSWFTDLAGRAEDFLNKVDQGAASALTNHSTRKSSLSSYSPAEPASSIQQSSEPLKDTFEPQHGFTGPSSNHESSTFISAAAGNIKKSRASVLVGTANVSSTTHLGSAPPDNGSGAVRASSNFIRPKKQEVDDDLLFDFLNSSDPPQSERRDVRKDVVPRVMGLVEGPAQGQITASSVAAIPQVAPLAPATPPSTRGLSRNSSLSSLTASTHSIKTEDGSTRDLSQGDSPESSDSGLAAPLDTPAVAESAPQEEQVGQVLSNLRLENQLLRSEVSSLNQEMASLVQRAKDTQEELNQARTRSEKWNTAQSRNDRTVRELRAQVDDLTEALSAKDAQLAILKVRLDEADQLLKARSSALEEAQNERTRILQDHSEGNSLHSQALQTLQDRLREVEVALKREQDNYRQMQSEFAIRLAKTEAERQTLAESLTGTERRVVEEKQRLEELQQQAKSARAAADYAKQELQDYKNKASRILQSKEKLISSLKESSGLDVLDGGAAAGVELEELRHEKELQREEIQKLQAQIHSLRSEIQELETQAVAETESWREQQQELHDQHIQQSRAKQEVEAELERCKQELHYVEEEQHRTKSTLQSRIKDREEEIQKLRNQLTNKTLSNSSQAELEGRLHQLTETLIQKQTMLEALGTEKSSLIFQLERLEQQLKSVQGGQSSGPHINMAAVEGPGARQRNTPVLFSDQDSSATGVYGKVRKAASTIDRFSIRLGIFLRRYPVARVFVILYMALLHLWVMIILMTYTPEMHPSPPGAR